MQHGTPEFNGIELAQTAAALRAETQQLADNIKPMFYESNGELIVKSKGEFLDAEVQLGAVE